MADAESIGPQLATAHPMEVGLAMTDAQSTAYSTFLARKRRVWAGQAIPLTSLPDPLFDWQRAIVRWALRKGRAAIFADCGL